MKKFLLLLTFQLRFLIYFVSKALDYVVLSVQAVFFYYEKPRKNHFYQMQSTQGQSSKRKISLLKSCIFEIFNAISSRTPLSAQNDFKNVPDAVSFSKKLIFLFGRPARQEHNSIKRITVDNKKNTSPLFFNLSFFPYISGTAWATKNLFTSFCTLF